MPQTIHCSHCQQLLSLRDEDVGKMVRCPRCTGVFTAVVEEQPPQPPILGQDFEIAPEHPPPPPAPQSHHEPVAHINPSPEFDGGIYAVQLDEEALVSPTNSGRPPRPSPISFEEEEPYVQPHRGVLILVLGILSLVLACIPLAGWILGGIAMSMASTDERLMREKMMDRTGAPLTKAGQVCAIFGVFLASLAFIVNVAVAVNRFRRE
jgi:phage FluMu protein Com